jgi:predicted TPR repeat methyltransferase
MSDKTFLNKAYDVDGPEGITKLYVEWAESYEAEVTANGYATPGRIAAALASVTDDQSLPVLDYGCGTGLSGNALASKGFSNITGADPSPEMLAFAKTKGVYSSLIEIDIKTGPPFEVGEFSSIAAIGVIGAGAAPVEVFDALFGLLKSGQRFALSLNDHTLEIAAFPDRVHGVVASGSAKLIFEEFGDHLPGQNMKSMVYILEKI